MMRFAPRAVFGLLVLLTLLLGVRAAGVLETLAELPECGVGCFMSMMDSTSCGIDDANCICAADDTFHEQSRACIIETCPIRYGLEVARIEATFCGRKERSRKKDQLLPLIIEIPAWISPWLRAYSRWRVVSEFAWDDWLMLVCGILYTVFVVLGHYTGKLALGVDVWTLDENIVTHGLKVFYVAETFYLVLLCLAKISIICFYLRIFSGRRFHQAAYAVMALVVIPTTVISLLQILQCRPINIAWEGWNIDGAREEHCLDVNTLAYIAAGFSIAQDVMVLALPLPLLLKLKVDTGHKVGIVVMFSLGVFVLVTSCVRLRYIASFGNTANPTWDYLDPHIWSGVEVAVSIIVACLPAVRALIHQVLPALSPARGSYIKEGTSTRTDRSGSRRKVSKVFGSKGLVMQKESESEMELGLQFWGPKKSEVLTEVSGLTSRESSPARQEDGIAGIRVKTTTTSRVDIRP